VVVTWLGTRVRDFLGPWFDNPPCIITAGKKVPAEVPIIDKPRPTAQRPLVASPQRKKEKKKRQGRVLKLVTRTLQGFRTGRSKRRSGAKARHFRSPGDVHSGARVRLHGAMLDKCLGSKTLAIFIGTGSPLFLTLGTQQGKYPFILNFDDRS